MYGPTVSRTAQRSVTSNNSSLEIDKISIDSANYSKTNNMLIYIYNSLFLNLTAAVDFF